MLFVDWVPGSVILSIFTFAFWCRHTTLQKASTSTASCWMVFISIQVPRVPLVLTLIHTNPIPDLLSSWFAEMSGFQHPYVYPEIFLLGVKEISVHLANTLYKQQK